MTRLIMIEAAEFLSGLSCPRRWINPEQIAYIEQNDGYITVEMIAQPGQPPLRIFTRQTAEALLAAINGAA